MTKRVGKRKGISVGKFQYTFYTKSKKMRTSALEQLAAKGIVIIQKKGSGWLVQFVRKDESGFLTDRQSGWGTKLSRVIRELLERASS